MTGRRILTFVAGLFFLLVGLGGFYRLMFGFPIVIGKEHLGHVSSFLVFVICVALSIALFRESRRAHTHS